MAKHDLSLKLPLVPIKGDGDVVFKIKKDGEPLGTLVVAKNSLGWRSAHPESSGPLAVSWTAFDEWIRLRKGL
jgi:hypothetical protein